MIKNDKEIGRWQQHATRAFFFIGGFGVASWAPLVPLLRERLGIGEDVLGMLLLCIGIGSLLTMPVAGAAAARFGCRRIILIASVLYACLLPVLCQISDVWLCALVLLCFGAVMGAVDIVVNVHAVVVEKAAKKPLMSGMHALWSVGGFMGAGMFVLLLEYGFNPLQSTLWAVMVMLILAAIFTPHLLQYCSAGKSDAMFVMPKGIVFFVGIICFIAFLVEGAIMDWSGVFLTTVRGMDLSLAGTGFAVFSAAMLCMRLGGDWLIQRCGGKCVVLWGSCLTICGFLLVMFTVSNYLLYIGFFLIGIGSANIVPIFFSLLGRQTVMPVNLAVSAVGTMGYLGILLGPAMIGFIAHQTSLIFSFALLTLLVILQIFIAKIAYKKFI